MYRVIRDGRWYTLRQIAEAAGAPEASVSARLRDFRNLHGMTVQKKRRNSGLWLYRVQVP